MGSCWRDRRFWLALLIPSLVLLAARFLGVEGTPSLAWPLRQPGRFCGLVLLWPVMEEVVFRGALQPYLTGMSWGRLRLAQVSAGNAIASLLFAVSHLYAHPPLWAALVFFPSLLFGYFRDRHESLLPAVYLHVVYNLGYYWLL